MIDLNNTCFRNNNPEILDYLFYNGYTPYSERTEKSDWLVIQEKVVMMGGNDVKSKYRQIQFVDGEFQYVNKTKELCDWINRHEEQELAGEEYKKDTFTKYGFEVPKFECEILKIRINRKKENCYIGYFVGKNGDAYPCEWTPGGRICKTSIPEHKRRPWDLTPIKKEWYENPDNFPCLIVSSQHNEMSRALRFEDSKIITDGTFRYSPNDVRLATKEELLSLYVEEITMSHTETN